MRVGYSDTCLAHKTGSRHPENPDRLRAIREGLAREHGVEYAEADPIDRALVTDVHDPDYVDDLEAFCEAGGGEWDPDTVAVPATWDAALTSAGLAWWAARTALDGADRSETPFSIGRPPGHHAVADDAMGFCFLNNVAIAARAGVERGDPDRVAVVDWDVHHGNGTQELFLDDGDVLFCSLHQRGLYPGTGERDEYGRGPGEGTTVNVPLPTGAGDPEYGAVLERIVRPALAAFDPELVLVSAGFDAHRLDPISRMRLSTEGYGHLAARLLAIGTDRAAPVAFVLEGGYGLQVLADCVSKINDVCGGYEPAEPDGDVNDDVAELVGSLEGSHPLLS